MDLGFPKRSRCLFGGKLFFLEGLAVFGVFVYKMSAWGRMGQ